MVDEVRRSMAAAVLPNEVAKGYQTQNAGQAEKRWRSFEEILADYAARPLQPSETIAAMTGKRGAV